MYIVYVHVGMSYASFKQTRAPTRDDFFLRWQEPAAWLQGPILTSGNSYPSAENPLREQPFGFVIWDTPKTSRE